MPLHALAAHLEFVAQVLDSVVVQQLIVEPVSVVNQLSEDVPLPQFHPMGLVEEQLDLPARAPRLVRSSTKLYPSRP